MAVLQRVVEGEHQKQVSRLMFTGDVLMLHHPHHPNVVTLTLTLQCVPGVKQIRFI